MTLSQIRSHPARRSLALAFGIPSGMMLVLMFITSAAPFGSYSMLYSDMFHQYYPFFNAFRQALRSGESLLWNWSAGMGMDYLGLISYYLASPLNLLSVLVPDSWSLGYFAMLMPVKLGLAGLFFGYMLYKLFDVKDYSIAMFGTLYGLCAWALGYQWNVMWLDSFALLPLVALGTVQLLRDKKFVLYTISLFLAVFANYYVGFFVCVFVLLLFICYEICRFKSIGRFFLDLGRIALFSTLAIGMTAVLELPALAALQNTQSSVNQFPEGFQVNIVSGEAVTAAKEAWSAWRTAKEAGQAELWPLLWAALKASWAPLTEAMMKVSGQMGGGQQLTYMDGLPNLYCGVLPVLLAFVFLCDRKVRLRDKLCSVCLLLFFILSFIIRQLDYIWHGFHFTNQIPYRFSFLYSFVVLYMAYRGWMVRAKIKLWQLVLSFLLSLGLLLLSPEVRTNEAYIAFNLAFLGLYFCALLFANRRLVPKPSRETADAPAEAEAAPLWTMLPGPKVRKRMSTAFMAAVILVELTLNLVIFASTFGIYDYDYPKNGDATASMLQVMREHEGDKNLFYRVETTHAQTLNDGPLNGYYGISTFTSSANVSVTKFMQSLGYGAWDTYNRYCYEDGSPVSNLFLNIKYMLEREFTVGENATFDVLHTYNNVTLLENNAYLPLGFLAQPELEELKFTTSNNLQFQNALFRAATGLEGDVFSLVQDKDCRVIKENVTTKMENVSGYTNFTTGSTGGKLTYEYTMTQEGLLCLDINLHISRNYSVWHNGVRLFSESYSLPQIIAVCDVKPGDTVQLVIEVNPNVDSAISIRGGVLDEQLFRRGYDVLNASTLELTAFSNTYLEGTIYCDRDGLLYTSIPQDGNWIALVDGREVDTTLVGEAMLALPVTEGTHTVAFRYVNKAFYVGFAISLACFAVFAGIVVFQRRQRKK